MSCNCPNCGAPWDHGAACEYCGTPNPDVLRAIHGKPVKLSYEVDGREYVFNFLVEDISVNHSFDDTVLYSDDSPYMTIRNGGETRLSLDGRLVPMDMRIAEGRRGEVLYTVKEV